MRDIYDGNLSSDVSWLLVATPTLVDPDRAPNGNHTVKLLTHTVYDLPGAGANGWHLKALLETSDHGQCSRLAADQPGLHAGLHGLLACQKFHTVAFATGGNSG